MAVICTLNEGQRVHLIMFLLLISSASTGTLATSDGDLRLVEGSSPNAGRLEIVYRGKWGTICSDGFGIPEAHVACSQLGYEFAQASIEKTFYEDGLILLGDVFCWGDESRLVECYHSDWNYANCQDSEVVGVICANGGGTGMTYKSIAALGFIALLIAVSVSSCVWVVVKDRRRKTNARTASSNTATPISSVSCGLNPQQQVNEIYGPCSVMAVPRLPGYTETNYDPPSYEATVAVSIAPREGVSNGSFELEECTSEQT